MPVLNAMVASQVNSRTSSLLLYTGEAKQDGDGTLCKNLSAYHAPEINITVERSDYTLIPLVGGPTINYNELND